MEAKDPARVSLLAGTVRCKSEVTALDKARAAFLRQVIVLKPKRVKTGTQRAKRGQAQRTGWLNRMTAVLDLDRPRPLTGRMRGRRTGRCTGGEIKNNAEWLERSNGGVATRKWAIPSERLRGDGQRSATVSSRKDLIRQHQLTHSLTLTLTRSERAQPI